MRPDRREAGPRLPGRGAMPKFKAHGHRGSWFADVNGEHLPCVHAHWWKGSGYHDPYARPGDAKFEKLLQGIRETGRGVVTKDDVSDGGRTFKRTGYVGVFKIEDPQLDDDGLRFRITNRIADLF